MANAKTVVSLCYINQGWNSTNNQNIHIKWKKVEHWPTPSRDSVFKKGREASKENWEEKIDQIDTAFLTLKRKCVLRKKAVAADSSEESSVTQFWLLFIYLWPAKKLPPWSG